MFQMRIKFLSFTASFLVLLLAVTSCLNSDDDYELGSDDTITAFEIDKIYGVSYKFTIDQKKGRIFNMDSVPFSADTIINKILITKITTNGYVTAGKEALQDTLFNTADSVNLLYTMDCYKGKPEHKPLVLRVRSYDGAHIKAYDIEVRIHQADPDSLVWGGGDQLPYSRSFSGGTIKGNEDTKSVLLNNQVLVYTSAPSGVVVYSQPASKPGIGDAWPLAATDLPLDAKVSSIVNYNDVLYAVNEEEKAYKSLDGTSWSEVKSTLVASESLEATYPDVDWSKYTDTHLPVTTLITTFGKEDRDTGEREEHSIAGIAHIAEVTDTEKEGKFFSSAAVDANGDLVWTLGDLVPQDEFPLSNLSATKSFKTTTGLQRVVAVGNKPSTSKATATIPWFSLDGLEWAAIDPSDNYALPLEISDPSIIYYNKQYYVFGSDFSKIYTSVDGRIWLETEEKFLFPVNKETGTPIFENRAKYSMVIDNDNYIWLVWGDGVLYTDEVWKGRLNRLGFLIQ